MIDELLAGLCVRLPSGNIVRLVRCDRGEWLCEYTHVARARGEVVFSGIFLYKFGRRA